MYIKLSHSNLPFARRLGGVLGHDAIGLKCTISGPRLSLLRGLAAGGLTAALLAVAIVTVAATAALVVGSTLISVKGIMCKEFGTFCWQQAEVILTTS